MVRQWQSYVARGRKRRLSLRVRFAGFASQRNRKSEVVFHIPFRAHSAGFTLAELIAVIAIMGILASIAIPSAIGYMRRARFAQNEENARAVFLAAESVLTYYRTSGQWNSIRDQIEAECGANTNTNVTAPPPNEGKSGFLGAFSESGGPAGKMEPRVKTLLFPGADSGGGVVAGTVADRLRTDMLSRVTDSSGLKNGAIAIEIDTESGRVYSAFYASSDKQLVYGTGAEREMNGTGDNPTLYIFGKNRSFESRRESLIGHYDAADAVEIEDLDKDYIFVMWCTLVNGEMLTLDITSDSQQNNADAKFKIEIFAADDETSLYELTIEPGRAGWSTDSILVKQTYAPASVDTAIKFPIYREGKDIRVVLDAISSPALVEADSNNDFSITRFPGAKGSGLSEAFNHNGGLYNKPIKCRVTPIAIDSGKTGGPAKWTDASEVMTGDGYSEDGGVPTYRIENFRHFYNARYIMEKTTRNVAFHVVNLLNWDEARMFVKNAAGAVNPEPVKGAKASFPVFATLKNARFVGVGDGIRGIRIMNLKIGNDSFQSGFSDTYAGLFCDVENAADVGISNIIFDNAVMKIDCSAEPFSGSSAELQGIGFLCGKNDGKISNVTVNDMSVTLANVYSTASRVVGDFSFGGLAGENTDQGKIDDCTVSGFAVVENIDPSNDAVSKTGNAGGIAGKNLGTITDASFGDKNGMHFKAENTADCTLCASNGDGLHFNKSDFSEFERRNEKHAVQQETGGAMEYWSQAGPNGNEVYVTANRVSIIKIGNGNAGGIAGVNSGTGSINVTTGAGGMPTGELRNYGLIYAKQGNVGGIAGKSDGTSTIAHATNYGTAAVGDGSGTVECNAGGVIGRAANTSATGCFNYGLVQAVGSDAVEEAAAGGIIGYLDSGSTSSGSSENHGTVLAYGKAAKAGGWLGNAINFTVSDDEFTNTASGFVYTSGDAACAGGVFGYAESVIMSNASTVGGKIEANGKGCSAGGIIGVMSGGEISATVAGAKVTAGAGGYAGGIIGEAKESCIIQFGYSDDQEEYPDVTGEGTLATAIGKGGEFEIAEDTTPIVSRTDRYIGSQQTNHGTYSAYYTREGEEPPYLYYIRSDYIETWQNSYKGDDFEIINNVYVVDIINGVEYGTCTDNVGGAPCKGTYTTATVVGVCIYNGYVGIYGSHNTSAIGKRCIKNSPCDHKIIGTVE